MAPKRQKLTPASTSSSSRLQQPSGIYASAKLQPEYNFNLDVFQAYDLAQWTLDYLAAADLSTILHAPGSRIYDRCVRLFYENLERTSDIQDPVPTFLSTIDGHQIILDLETASDLLDVHMTRPANCTLLDPRIPKDIADIAGELTGGTHGKGYSIRRTMLPDNLLFLDSVIEKNLAPSSHSERRDAHLHALYGAWKGQWFSPAVILLQSIERTRLFLKAKTKSDAKIGHPIFISSLLDHAMEDSPSLGVATAGALPFGMKEWRHSIDRIDRLKPNPPPPRAAAAADPDILDPTLTAINALSTQFATFSTHQDLLDRRQRRMLFIQETMMRRQYPDADDVFAEAYSRYPSDNEE